MPGPFSKSSLDTCDGTCSKSFEQRRQEFGNPDPRRYGVLSHTTVNGYLILELHYPNCTNYEGRKVLLFDRGVTMVRLKRQNAIDPHFSNSAEYNHPIARFEPTARGHAMAVRLAQTLDSEFGARHE
jgi:hypothetical protein